MRKTGTLLWMLLPILAVVSVGTGAGKEHMSNAAIVADIEDLLYHAHVYDHGQVHAAFADGVATLTGTVDSYGAKLDAERAASKQQDVVQVVDQITVDTDDISPEQILQKARHDILTYYAYTIFDYITLQTEGNKLIVGGAVDQPFKKADIGNFLARIKGVSELVNNIEVLPTSNYDDELRIQIARAIYDDPYFVQYADQANPPIHIIVKNGNVTLYGVVNSEVDKEKAATDARFAGTFFSLTNNLQVEH